MPGTFELKKSSDGQFRFSLLAVNHEKLLASEGYTTKAAALSGIESVRINAPDDARYQRKNNGAGAPMFNLLAANHQVIGTSEAYSSTAARDNGIQSVKANAPAAALKDRT